MTSPDNTMNGLSRRACCAWFGAGFNALAVAIGLTIWLTHAVCPVTYDSFYGHLRESAANYPSVHITEATAEKVASWGMLLADQINREDNRFRSLYRGCVQDFGPANTEKWRPFTVEEACLFIMMQASAQTGAEH